LSQNYNEKEIVCSFRFIYQVTMTNSDAKDQTQIDQERESLAQMRAITISREYGSGGGEIASRLARRLGWQLIDHEVVVRVAQELGVSEADAAEYDECGDGPLSRVLQSFRLVQPTMPVSMPIALITDSRAYNIARCHAIMGAYVKGHTVIVGRGGQALLAQQRDVLHVRVVAPFDLRLVYVMRREGLDQAAAHARIHLKDRDRQRFLQEENHQQPADAHLYDLVVNTAVLDLESIVDIILLALQRKARRLSTSPAELGPGAGLASYPEQPEDFLPPEVPTRAPSG
jgi:cytidylate kinase